MGAMPVLVRSALRIHGVTPCGIGLCGIECRNGTPSEVFMCGANAAVQDIDMHSFTSAVPRVHVIERQIQLVDAVQPPRQRCGLYAGECTSRLGRKTFRRRSSTGVVEVCNSGCRALGHGTATGSGLGSGRQWNFVNVENFHWHALCCILHVGMLAQQALQVNKRCLDANHRQTLSRWKALEEQLTFGWQLLRNFFYLGISPIGGDLDEPIPKLDIRTQHCTDVCPALRCRRVRQHLPLQVHGDAAH
mmetsp:Transcript_59600/g.194426  ORF Transcript_59600/g.194426 Transcript_59600/m.194426 type:complete len:247 (+) Transcript_59600:803-1543(+)